MSHALPITLALFTTTKGHFGRRTDWRVSLDHLDKQLPLSLFGAKVASLKVTPGDEERGHEMKRQLEERGFTVMAQVGEWVRGSSHQRPQS